MSNILSDIQLRLGEPGDKEQIHKVRQASWRKAYRGILPEQVILEATSDELLKPNTKWGGHQVSEEVLKSRLNLVALENNKIIGFAAGGVSRDAIANSDCELWAIYMHPDHQRKNIGRLLFEEFKKIMVSHGMKKMIVWVLKDNHASRKFYENLGGVVLAQEKEFKWNGHVVAMEVAYLWPLR